MKRVLIPITDGSEELEAVTIIDLLRRAGIEVTVASLSGDAVKCSRGTWLVPDTSLDQALQSEYDMLALPGGLPGANHLAEDARIKSLVQEMNTQQRFVAAICAAPKVLARAFAVFTSLRRIRERRGTSLDQAPSPFAVIQLPIRPA